MSEVPDEIRDLQSNVALSMITDLMKYDYIHTRQGKINQEQADAYKKKFQKLHDTVVTTFKNHHMLWEKSKKLKTQLTTEKQNLETAIGEQVIAQEKAQQLNANLKKAEGEYEIQEHEIDRRQFELDGIEHEKSNIMVKIQEQERQAQSKAAPELEKKDAEIQALKDELYKRKEQMEQDQRFLAEQTERIAQFKNDNDDKLNEISRLHDEQLKIKDDPTRFAKNADMLSSANAIMNKDLQGYLDDITKKDRQLKDINDQLVHLTGKLQEYEQQIDADKKKIDLLNQDIKIYSEEINKLKEEHNDLQGEKCKNDIDTRHAQMEIRRHNDAENSLNKLIDQDKKEYKKTQIQINQINDNLYEAKMIFENLKKEESLVRYELEKQDDIRLNVQEENLLLEGKFKTVQEKTLHKENDKAHIMKQIQLQEEQLLQLQAFEAEGLKKLKALTATRESMARKASSALAEVRETREELKIKELLILDLTKKYQETEVKLNNFKSLYEEVKQARNKYVNLIQNSSQDLAELKERIKILQNELEILKNESQEKERTLLENKHCLQVEVHKKDRTHAKLNKLEYIKKQKNEVVEQNVNEIKKLNMIIVSLEKDMLNLRKQYEQVCESRNYTGVQLIDRNDELCVLYEKSNIQDNILKSGELEIKRLEDEIRMIKIEISEQKRRIDVARQQIVLVPQLADKVIQLKNELELEKRRGIELANELENPDNPKRFRELGGEDPDQEALDAKIHVLEERLNNKKEQLLEKELILDEITNLSEKLRKQALDGRLTTLELSEKVNQFQAKLKDLTRKMMATIAELSIFQAKAIKLQQEREETDATLDVARSRFDEGMPPLPEFELEYLNQVKYQLRYEEERQKRQMREEEERVLEPFQAKTRAKKRVDQYIPDDGSGIPLPKNYGKQAPFYPQETCPNIRHYRKPKIPEVEI